MRRQISLSMIVGIVLAVALTACGPQPPETVEMTLTEFGIESPITTFKIGQPYQFVITNKGAVSHEFVIMRPLNEGEMAMAGHGMEEALVEVKEEKLPPGATVTIEYTFTQPMSPGDLEIACHVTGHYAAGMKMPISVQR